MYSFETCFRLKQIRSFGFQGECLYSMNSISAKKRLMTDETKEMKRPNDRGRMDK